MKCRHFFIIAFLFFWDMAHSQTKLIAHKSHSGSHALFTHVLAHNLFGIDNSNFGAAPEPMVRQSNLDSVIFVSDTMAVMVTSYQCMPRRHSAFSSRWNPGRDTVIRHPLFSMKHELDSIRKSLKRDYFFENDVDSVKFIGYDNKVRPGSRKRNKQEFAPVSGNSGNNDMVPFFVLLAILSAAAGFFSWKFVKA